MRRGQQPSETPLSGQIEALIAPPPPVRAQEEAEGAGTTTPASNEATPTADKATPKPAYTATAADTAGTPWPQPLPADPPQHPILIDYGCHRVIDWSTMHICGLLLVILCHLPSPLLSPARSYCDSTKFPQIDLDVYFLLWWRGVLLATALQGKKKMPYAELHPDLSTIQ